MRTYNCEPDAFAKTLEQILGDIAGDISEETPKAVTRVARRGAKQLRSEAASRWSGKTGATYSAGFSSRVTGQGGGVVSAEIGNDTFPGLVHLLEKGHATLTGRRTAAYPHMAPVFEDIQDDLIAEVGRAVDKALGG